MGPCPHKLQAVLGHTLFTAKVLEHLDKPGMLGVLRAGTEDDDIGWAVHRFHVSFPLQPVPDHLVRLVETGAPDAGETCFLKRDGHLGGEPDGHGIAEIPFRAHDAAVVPQP